MIHGPGRHDASQIPFWKIHEIPMGKLEVHKENGM
jgi:hypothetical protein